MNLPIDNWFSISKAGEIASLDTSVFILGKICIILAIFFAHESGLALLEANSNTLDTDLSLEDLNQNSQKAKVSLSDYQVIAKRNVFGKIAQAKPQTKNAPISKLKLRLVGTSITPDKKPFAIIENSTKREQDIFDVNDSIFGQAKLIEIFKESVRIEYKGKIETLVLDDGTTSPATSEESSSITSEDGSNYVVSEDEVNDALANLPRLLSQARAVPYFKNGKSVGMRLFAIRRGSLYEKLGLKNGDILKNVNNNSLSDPTQALKIFEQLKEQKSIKVELERAGKLKSFNYEIR